MDFLQPRARKKIIRTTLYGDQEFTKWELEIPAHANRAASI